MFLFQLSESAIGYKHVLRPQNVACALAFGTMSRAHPVSLLLRRHSVHAKNRRSLTHCRGCPNLFYGNSRGSDSKRD